MLLYVIVIIGDGDVFEKGTNRQFEMKLKKKNIMKNDNVKFNVHLLTKKSNTHENEKMDRIKYQAQFS